eukprot:symbB.v1.2.010858.t1/scaffold716.1/size187362/11
MLRILVLRCTVAVATCTGQPPVFATPQPGLSLSFGREVAPNGTILPLQSTEQQDTLADGQNRSIPCRDLHWGLDGTATLLCTNSNLQVDTLGCLRVGCPWHRLSAAGGNLYSAPSNGLSTGGTSDLAAKWTAPVLAWDGALYAAPQVDTSVLRVSHDTSGAALLEIEATPSLSENVPMFGSVVLGSDGFVYGIPYSASQAPWFFPGGRETRLVFPGGARFYVLIHSWQRLEILQLCNFLVMWDLQASSGAMGHVECHATRNWSHSRIWIFEKLSALCPIASRRHLRHPRRSAVRAVDSTIDGGGGLCLRQLRHELEVGAWTTSSGWKDLWYPSCLYGGLED